MSLFDIQKKLIFLLKFYNIEEEENSKKKKQKMV
jgi:hypothetical protein